MLIKNFEFDLISTSSRLKSQADEPWMRSHVRPAITKNCFEIGYRRDIKISIWIRCQLVLE